MRGWGLGKVGVCLSAQSTETFFSLEVRKHIENDPKCEELGSDLCALSSGSLWCMGHRSTTDHLMFGPQALHQNQPNDVQSDFKSIWSSEHVPN